MSAFEIIGIVFMVVLLLIINLGIGYQNGYKQGQLDYSQGKVKYHWVAVNEFKEINHQRE